MTEASNTSGGPWDTGVKWTPPSNVTANVPWFDPRIPMHDQEIRSEALEQATRFEVGVARVKHRLPNEQAVIDRAKLFEDYIRGQKG